MNKSYLKKKISEDIERFLSSGGKIVKLKEELDTKKMKKFKLNPYSFNSQKYSTYNIGFKKCNHDERFHAIR